VPPGHHTPLLLFLVRADSKGLNVLISLLKSTLARHLVGVDFKRVAKSENRYDPPKHYLPR
jgi:hypothetical protein